MSMFKECSVSVFMKEIADDQHVDHFYSPLYNSIFSIKNPFWKYSTSLNHLKSSILIPFFENNGHVKNLRIHSHGNKNPPKPHLKNGPLIRMGEDNLGPDDFDRNGNPCSGPVEDLLRELKNVMAENAKITFDSCNQVDGELLKNISRFLGKNIAVSGFSGFGAPLINGDLTFRNGIREVRNK